KSNLFFGKLNKVFIDSLENRIYHTACKADLLLHCVLVSGCVNMWLLKEHKIDSVPVKLFIKLKSFFCITAHSADGIEDDGFSGLNLQQELIKFFSALELSSSIYLFNDLCVWVSHKNISHLSVYI